MLDEEKIPGYETLQPWMHPFPAPQDVFAGDIKAHTKYFQPLISIDACEVDPSWQGRFHFVSPREPYDGALGEESADYFHGYCVKNFISFKRKPDGRLEFQGDWRYFILGREDKESLPAHVLGYYDKLVNHYEKTELSLRQTKAFFEQHGFLNSNGQADSPSPWLTQVGGVARHDNWSSNSSIPIEREHDDSPLGDYMHPLTHDGRRFRFVGQLSGYFYVSGAADWVLMFYDPVESIVLFTFNWT